MLTFMRRAIIVLLLLAACRTTNALRDDDAAHLLALHQKSLEAHLASDVEMLLADEADDFVVVSRGNISHPTKAQRREFLGPYLQRTKFEEYRDSVEPIVRVSNDGTLGWVIVQVTARGTQQTAQGPQPLTFVSAWISLYEKRNGRWMRTGNVSNFREPVK